MYTRSHVEYPALLFDTCEEMLWPLFEFDIADVSTALAMLGVDNNYDDLHKSRALPFRSHAQRRVMFIQDP